MLAKTAAPVRFPSELTLIGQPHFLQQFGATRVMKQAFHQRTGFHLGQAGVALSIGALEPSERVVGLSAKCVNLTNLKGGLILMSGDEFVKRVVGLCTTPKLLIS